MGHSDRIRLTVVGTTALIALMYVAGCSSSLNTLLGVVCGVICARFIFVSGKK